MGDLDPRIQAGMVALDSGKPTEAFRVFLEYAQEGNAQAQANLGLLYSLGVGADRDISQAISWLEKAVGQGYGVAAHNLGTLYLTCEPDLPLDRDKSRKYFLMAYEIGFIVTSEDFYENLRAEQASSITESQ